MVHVGENFHLRYKMNSVDVRNFTQGNIPDAIQVLYGPAQSVNISSSNINGRTSSTEELTMTFVLSATEQGTFTIPPATAVVGGRQVKSQSLTVRVIEAQQRVEAPSASTDNFFIVVSTSKQRVNYGEPFLLTYKVCWHPDLPVPTLDEIKLELQDAYVLPYNDTQRKDIIAEEIGGRVMETVNWRQYVVYPQKTGTLHIPSVTMQGSLTEIIRNPIDPFLNMTRQIPRQLTARGVDIAVDDLPQRPAQYSGGVGHFGIAAELDKSKVGENVPVKLTVTVSGSGNLKMLREPVVAFPPSFDTYDVKQTDNYSLTADGLNGSITYEYVAVPQKRGTYTIPPASLVYFDTGTRRYETILTDSFSLKVLPGDGSSGSVQDFSGGDGAQAGDIHSLRTGPDSTTHRQSFFASTAYYALMAVIALLGIVAWGVLTKRARGRADAVGTKRKRANRVAVRRLRKAAQLMRSGKSSEFYDEALRALWGYVGDKLNIAASNLSRENISQQLTGRGVDEQVTNSFIEAIDECEFVRYAPGDPQGNMNRVYDKSITAIEQIESVKNVRKATAASVSSLSALLLTVLLSLSSSAVYAQSKVQADDAYQQEDYEKAIAAYLQIISKQGATADVYYNLGNAYFRVDSLASAILSWERALRLEPGDDDARYNLQVARSKTVDKIAPEREMFFITWYRSLVSLFPVDVWAAIGVCMLLVAVVSLLVYLFADAERLRRLTFFIAVAAFVLFLLSQLFAWQQQRSLQRHDEAIIMADTLSVKDSPAAGGSQLFTIHAGTKVVITDDTLPDWKQITLPDGRSGWVETSTLETI